MLHCNMNTDQSLQLSLDDLLADLGHARRQGDLGRLALIAYCEVRRWARHAGEAQIAEHASEMITASPHANREDFLAHIDEMMRELSAARSRLDAATPTPRASLVGASPGWAHR